MRFLVKNWFWEHFCWVLQMGAPDGCSEALERPEVQDPEQVLASGVPFLNYYETATIPHHSSWLRNGAACWFSSEKMIANVRNRCACSRYEVYGMLIQITACCSAIYHLVPELIAKFVAKLGCRQPWICWPKARRRARRRFFLTAPLLSIREHRYRDTDIQTQAESRPDTF